MPLVLAVKPALCAGGRACGQQARLQTHTRFIGPIGTVAVVVIHARIRDGHVGIHTLPHEPVWPVNGLVQVRVYRQHAPCTSCAPFGDTPRTDVVCAAVQPTASAATHKRQCIVNGK